MNFPFLVARRYLFSKKSHNAINIISAISVAGVALATMAMVCTLSVFNGFHDLVGGLYTAFDPQLRIIPATGKTFAYPSDSLSAALRTEGIAAVSPTLDDQALILFRGKPTVIRIKGVSKDFQNVTAIDSILYAEDNAAGTFRLQAAEVEYGIPGIGVASLFGTINFGTVEICAPRPGERINLANPMESFNVENLTSSGTVFQVHQNKYDNNYILASLDFTQRLFEKPGEVSALELRLAPTADEQQVQASLQARLGDRFTVQNRYEQQEDVFRVMNVEKMVAYIFLTFIVLVASFNIIGSVSMLIIEKRNDMQTMRYLGAKDSDISRVFFLEGFLISFLGAVIGVVLGIALTLVQQQWGVLKLAGSDENFIITSYPVALHFWDIFLIFLTALAVGVVSVWYPVRYLSRRWV